MVETFEKMEKSINGGRVRKNYLDVAKLITVLCVVYCHCITVATPVSDAMIIFFMPAFFVMYGMAVSVRSIPWKQYPSFLKSRTRSLLVPYVLWALIYSARRDGVFWENLFMGNNQALGRAETNMVLWFLPCMFTATVLFQIYSNMYIYIYQTTRKSWVRWGFVAVALAVCVGVSLGYNGFLAGGRVFGVDIAFLGCLFMITGSKIAGAVEKTGTLPCILKFLLATVGFVITYLIAVINMPYHAWTGGRTTTMAWGVYGRLDLFIIASLIGTVSVILISMLFERNTLLAWMGQFSLTIMAVHYILYIFVLPLCSKVLSMKYGAGIYPALVAIAVFLMCIPLCCIVNWVCPELNGKAVKIQRSQAAERTWKDMGAHMSKTTVGVVAFILLFGSTSLVAVGYLAMQPDMLFEAPSANAPMSPMSEQSDFRQYFVSPTAVANEVEVLVGTYMRENHGQLVVGLYEADTDRQLTETRADISEFTDNQYCSIEIPKTGLSSGAEYYLKFGLERESEEDMLTIYRSAEGTANETDYAVIDGVSADYSLCVKLIGKT